MPLMIATSIQSEHTEGKSCLGARGSEMRMVRASLIRKMERSFNAAEQNRGGR